MAAVDHIHPQQMQLFVDPVEHIRKLRGSVDLDFSSSGWHGMWKDKEQEARAAPGSSVHGAGIYESVKKYGIIPRSLHPDPTGGEPEVHPAHDNSGWVQGEGHHRIAAAAAVQRDTGRQQWVPLRYTNRLSRANRLME